MLGAYYNNPQSQLVQDGVRGLGNLSTQDQFALQELQQILAGNVPGVPGSEAVGVFSPWGQQSGSVDWQTVQPDHDLVIYPISDQQISAVGRATFGIPLGFVAVITTSPVTLQKAEAAFDNTPFAFSHVEGIFRLDDAKSVPSIYFLYWGTIREPTSAGGGNSKMQSVADLLGGTLVFPLQIPRTGQERPLPAVSFSAALSTQLAATAPAVSPAVAASLVAAPSALAPPAPAARPWWLLPVVGGGAAALGVYLYRRSQRKAG